MQAKCRAYLDHKNLEKGPRKVPGALTGGSALMNSLHLQTEICNWLT